MMKFEAEEARRKENFEEERRREEREEKRRREEREAEEARRREEREAEEVRRKEEREKVAREAEERIALYQLQEQELRIKEAQWEWQKNRDIRDSERQQTPAARVKFFGSVLKNVMPKFPTDVADVPIFFEGVEKLFTSFDVPAELQAKLLTPYLNDKAKSLLIRLEQMKQDNYSEVKAFLLNEFKLTPTQFKERFDRANRNRDETYTMFCSRLKNLLTYYCSSRHVKESFKTLFSLLVSDKIKSTLPEACLDHVLTMEGDKWLECDALANVVDIYFANHTVEGQPKYFRSDFKTRTRGDQASGHVANKASHDKQNFAKNSQENASRESKGARTGNFAPGDKSGLCFKCHSPGHKQAQCPMRGNSSQNRAETRGVARNFACAVETPRDGNAGSVTQPTSRSIADSEPVTLGDDGSRSANVCRTDDQARPNVDAYGRKTSVSNNVAPASDASQSKPVVKPTSNANAATYRSARAIVSESTEACNDNNLITGGLSKLNYIPIRLQGIDGVHNALHDSGSEINLINRNVLKQCMTLPSMGRVKIKGVVGPAVETDIVSLEVNSIASDNYCRNIAPPLREIFAVCDDLNEGVILTADTVNRLSTLHNYESIVVKEHATTILNETRDNETIAETTNVTDNVNISEDAGDERKTESTTDNHFETDSKSANTITLIDEQRNDPSLAKYFDMIRRGNKQFFLRDGLLYRRGKVNGNQVDQLCLPQGRVRTVLRVAHDMPASGHQAVRRTNDRIAMSFFFPGQWQCVKNYCDSCDVCQIRTRERRTDLVPIKPIDRHEENFGHLQADIIGPMSEGQYKYALVLTDVQTRYVTAFEITAPSAKNVVDKIILHSSYFGLPRYISFDCGTHFTSELTKLCLDRLGVSPRFHCPYNPRAAGIVERSNATVKQIISKLAADNPSSWHKILPFALWSLRTSVNETLGISPHQAVFGSVAIGPLQLLCDDWIGKRPLPLDIAKAPCEYLQDLERKLQLASDYTTEHATREQTRYTHSYNLRSRDKSFQVGERVIYLMPSSTHKLARTWQGPCVVVKKNSPYSYIIEYEGKQRWCHANHLRKYNERVIEASNHNCAIIFDTDCDFGILPTLYCTDRNVLYDTNMSKSHAYHNEVSVECVDHRDRNDSARSSPCLSEDVLIEPIVRMDNSQCRSFSSVTLVRGTRDHCEDQSSRLSLPSARIDRSKLSHLSESQQRELLEILDEFGDCFNETPGFCPYVEHNIIVDDNFKPKRLREYRIPEVLKPEVQRQIDELVRNKFIRPSNSPMASPIVVVLKGPDGKGGVRLAIDYRFVNSHTRGDAFVMPHLMDSIQKVGTARFISVFDGRSSYWQLGVKEEHKWLTAFAYEGGLFEWNRTPFGLKCSGNTFCRCIQMIIQPIRDFCFPFVDDLSVCSETWSQHLSHTRSFLREIRKSGLTLSLNKCSLAKNEVRFVGHIIGSGRHRPDEEKLKTISDIAKPTTKRDVRRLIGFFNYFQSYVPQLAELCVPFTNALGKGKPNVILWTSIEERAFTNLKDALRECVRSNLYTVKYGHPFGIHCDASRIAVGSCLVQWDDDGREKPIAFASSKLSGAQLVWAAVEKEAYAVIWSLNKFRTWIFGAPITIIADSNPLTYLTASAPKSAKLTRWALALQEFDVTFKYRKGRDHVVPDYLSRPN
ncbi:MAG TPA: RNase H-like domain-containing protein [Nitrosomonas sp.]|nr:RNase H-like domain-containing protein [Nitrosomonas sp.]